MSESQYNKFCGTEIEGLHAPLHHMISKSLKDGCFLTVSERMIIHTFHRTVFCIMNQFQPIHEAVFAYAE